MLEQAHGSCDGRMPSFAKAENCPGSQERHNSGRLRRLDQGVVFPLDDIFDPMHLVFEAAAMIANQGGSLLGKNDLAENEPSLAMEQVPISHALTLNRNHSR